MTGSNVRPFKSVDFLMLIIKYLMQRGQRGCDPIDNEDIISCPTLRLEGILNAKEPYSHVSIMLDAKVVIS